MAKATATAKTRTLEITVISGEGLLLNHKRPVKKNTFAIIREDDSQNYRMTKMDREGGSWPSWNEKFVLDVPMHVTFITVEVHCKTSFGNKMVGTACVPVSDFVGGYTPASYLHILSYRLREGNGERNGIINLSVRVKVPPEYSVGSLSRQQPWQGTPVGEKDCGQVVTGVPVCCSYSV